MQQETKGIMLGMIGVIIFGLTLPVTRYVLPYMDPIFVGLGRAVLAASVAVLVLLASRTALPSRQQLWLLVMTSLGVVIGFPVLSAWAMQWVPASHGGVVLGLLPLATAAAAALVAGERPSLKFWLAAVLGSSLVIVYSLLQGFGQLQWGDLALLASVVAAAIGYATGAQVAKQLGGWQVICWALVIALPVLLVPAWMLRPIEFAAVPPAVWLGFAYLALMSQLFGFFFWNRGLALGGIARVSQTQLLQPFVTIIAAALLLQEALSQLTIGFALAVMLVVAIGRRMPVAQSN